MPAQIPARSGEDNHDAFFKFMNGHPNLKTALNRAGLVWGEEWVPIKVTTDGRVLGHSRVTRFRIVEPRRTDRQRRIMDLMLEWGEKTWIGLWTSQDLALALGLDPNNQGVIGQIGQDCAEIRAHSRQVPRLVGSQRLHVYCLDPLEGVSLKKLRAIYRWEAERRKLSRPSTEGEEVAVRLP